jgi:alginate O-acetyltransferase complex protein AlgI
LSYTSFLFLAFLGATACLHCLCPSRWRPLFLLAISYLFYLTWEPMAALLLAGLSMLTFFAARASGPSGRLAPVMALALAACLAAFKIALLTPARGLGGLVMPLGISYYTFKLISYVLDVHWGKIAPEKSLIRFAAYVSFFPQIVAGPIQRPGDFLAQLPPNRISIAAAAPRLAWGLTQKLLIADNLAPAVNYVYAHVAGLQGAPLWIGFYLFPLQLYADFSGLTDIAIGAGRLFGINGPENFNRPFAASSISEFWRRWHMSLTNWLADYVFLPLRMATRAAGNAGLAFSITVNMVAIGLWHGLTGGFLLFGLFHSAFLIADVFTSRQRSRFFKHRPGWNAPGAFLGWLLTFHLVAVTLVFFRASRVSDALWLLEHLWMGQAGSGPLPGSFLTPGQTRNLAIGFAGYAVLELGKRYRPDLWVKGMRDVAPRWVRWSLYSASAVVLAFGLCLLLVHTSEAKSPFIYEIF